MKGQDAYRPHRSSEKQLKSKDTFAQGYNFTIG